MKGRGDPKALELMEKPEFYEELLLLEAQELIAQLMEEKNINKAELARKIGKSKAHVTNLLSSGRNLTLKSLANVCYHLGAQVSLEAKLKSGPVGYGYSNFKQPLNDAAVLSAASIICLPNQKYLM